MKNQSLKIGTLAGLIVVAYSVAVFFWMDGELTPEKYATAEVLGFLRYLVLAAAVLWVMWKARQDNSAPPTFKNLIGKGILVTLVVALFVGLMEAAYISFNPEFMEQAQDIYLKRMVADGASATEIADMQTQMESYAWMKQPALSGLFYFVETMLVGSVASLILALLIRKKAAA